jgi:hypothetical protein
MSTDILLWATGFVRNYVELQFVSKWDVSFTSHIVICITRCSFIVNSAPGHDRLAHPNTGDSYKTRFRYPRFRICAVLFRFLRDISILSVATVEAVA